MVMSLGQKEI